MISLGTALPAIIAAWKAAPATAKLDLGALLLMLLAGCVAGLATVFPSLKKS